MIDGDRTFIWSGEFHPFRLPSPSLWFDVLQKMKASDCNAVSMYFNWSYHSPAPGDYDFTGVRDMDTALGMAADAGLYVIARPGPYINAEVNAGGYPGWLTRPRDARVPTSRPIWGTRTNTTGDLLIGYTHSGVAEVRVTPAGAGTGGTAQPLLLLVADDDASATFWRHDTPAGAVLVNGPDLVRTARLDGAALRSQRSCCPPESSTRAARTRWPSPSSRAALRAEGWAMCP